jgi:NitT/TauT family transport system substrate-binding protein
LEFEMTRFRVAAVFAIIAVAMAACSAPSATGTSTTASSANPGASVAASQASGTKQFAQARGGSAQLADVPELIARDTLNAAGYSVTLPVVKDNTFTIDGVSSGTFQFGYTAMTAALVAIQKGAPIKIILNATLNEYTMYSLASVTKCADLDGKKVAISSVGGVSTALMNAWIAEQCPTAKPSLSVIADSDARAAALLAGQIDASPLAIEDGLALEQKGGSKIRLLADFTKTLPNLTVTVMIVNSQWAAANPGSVQAFLRAQLQTYRQIASDPTYLANQVAGYKTELGYDPAPSAIDRYRSMFDLNGGLSTASMQYTIDFFTKNGSIQAGLTPQQATDTSYLNAVLDQIGRK